jgi:hypothetical protein
MFLDLPDPDPSIFIRIRNKDPSIINQKLYKNLGITVAVPQHLTLSLLASSQQKKDIFYTSLKRPKSKTAAVKWRRILFWDSTIISIIPELDVIGTVPVLCRYTGQNIGIFVSEHQLRVLHYFFPIARTLGKTSFFEPLSISRVQGSHFFE